MSSNKKVIILKNAKFIETTQGDGARQLVGVVQGDSFLNVDVPMDPNPRQFLGDVNPHYKEMMKTLKSEPKMFARKNSGGITMFATACDSNGDGSYTVVFTTGDGIANGGHTYNALKRFGRSDSWVKVTIEIGLNQDDKVDIAEALNLARRLPMTTLQNKKGAFEWHKEFLREYADDVIYYEGDTGKIEVREEFTFLNLFKYNQKTKELDIMVNFNQSESANSTFIQRVAGNQMNYIETSLKWIARDVHELVLYTLYNPVFIGKLQMLTATSGGRQNWTKRRGTEKERSLVKGIGLLLISGLANVATKLNKNGIVMWRDEFKEPEARTKFISELFEKVCDIVAVEEGAASSIIKMESVRKKVLKHSKILHNQMTGFDQNKKLLEATENLQLQFEQDKTK